MTESEAQDHAFGYKNNKSLFLISTENWIPNACKQIWKIKFHCNYDKITMKWGNFKEYDTPGS